MLAATPIRPSSVLRLPFSPRARTQIGLFVLAYLVYSAARFVTIGDLGSAKDNAHWIVNLQNSLHIGVESSVQGALDTSWLVWIFNHLYLIAQLGVIPAALMFLWFRNQVIYRTLRNTILATWLLSVPVYGLFPVAPPRLADIGIVDTISTHTMNMNSSVTTSFYNELAAVPSLHVGFAMAVSIALFAAVRNPVVRYASLLWGPLIALVVVATGNHFVFDAIAGIVASVLGYALGAMAMRIRIKRPTATRSSLGPAFAEA